MTTNNYEMLTFCSLLQLRKYDYAVVLLMTSQKVLPLMIPQVYSTIITCDQISQRGLVCAPSQYTDLTTIRYLATLINKQLVPVCMDANSSSVCFCCGYFLRCIRRP